MCIAGGYDNEPTCGRPLGMRLDPDGYLIVCDAYLGIYKVNVATGNLYSRSLRSNLATSQLGDLHCRNRK